MESLPSDEENKADEASGFEDIFSTRGAAYCTAEFVYIEDTQ